MSFFGLFGQNRDTTAAQNPVSNPPKPPPSRLPSGVGSFDLPDLPPVGQTPPIVADLPKAPPPAARRASLFDKDHRKESFLAIAAGMGQGLNFGDGLGAAARNLYGLQQDLRQEGRPVLGGPDDAFEIYTDPQTGERSYKPVKEFVEYNENKRTKQKDVADINGRVMYAISQLPEAARPAAYQENGRACGGERVGQDVE